MLRNGINEIKDQSSLVRNGSLSRRLFLIIIILMVLVLLVRTMDKLRLLVVRGETRLSLGKIYNDNVLFKKMITFQKMITFSKMITFKK